MALKDGASEDIAFFSGQKSGAPLKSLKPQDSTQIKNFHLIQNTLKKINGGSQYAQLETINASEGIVWLEHFGGQIFAQKGSNVWTETLPGSATFASASFGSSDRIFSTGYKRELFLANGRYLKLTNRGGATTGALRDWGLAPPLGAVTTFPSTVAAVSPYGVDNNDVSTTNGSGTLTNSGVYRWTLTLYDAETNVESPAVNSRPGEDGLYILVPQRDGAGAVETGGLEQAPSYWNKTLGGSDDTATFTFASINALINSATNQSVSSRATHFRIYRTENGLTTFKLVPFPLTTTKISTFIAAATTLVDIYPDTSLGQILEDALRPPPSVDRMTNMYLQLLGIELSASSYSTYKHVRNFRDSIFGIGAKTVGVGSNTGLGFSQSDSNLYIHEPFNPDYVADIRRLDDGDEAGPGTAVAVLKDSVVLAFKERSSYYLIGNNVSDYQVRLMDSKRGCVYAGSIRETPIGVFSLDYSGIVLFSGVGPGTDLSNPDVADIIARINWNAITTCYSSYDHYDNNYTLSVPVDGANYPNLTITYNTDSKGFTFEEGVEGRSRKYSTDFYTKEKVGYQGSRTDGLIINISSETTVKMLNNPITATWTSAPLFFGEPKRKKKAKFLYITAESAQDFTIDIDIIPDFGQGQYYSLTDVNSATLYSVYAASLVDTGANVGVFDESYWGETKSVKQLKIPVYGIGYAFQIRITNRESDANKYGFRIIAVELESVMLKK